MCQNMVQEWSCVRETKTRVSWPRFLQKLKKLFLDYAFMPLPGVADRSEFTSDCSLPLDTVVCLYALMEKYVLAVCSLPATCGLPLWLCTVFLTLRVKSINCPMLQIKLAVLRNFSLIFTSILLAPGASRVVNSETGIFQFHME